MLRRLLLILVLISLSACTDRRRAGDDDDAADDDDDVAADDDDAAASVPTAPLVRIEPELPSAGEAILCFVEEDSVDPLGREVDYEFVWLLDANPTDRTGAVVDAGVTEGGDLWTCVVTPVAGGDAGPAGRDEVEIALPNRPPGAPTIAIEPAAPRSNQPARCVVVVPAEDPDGDALSLSYDWRVSGLSQGWTDPVLPATATLEGQRWTCVVTASDGEWTGPEAEAEATIDAPAWTPDVTDQGVAYSASSCFSCPQDTWYIADKAFDDNTGTGANSWHTTWTGGPEWVAVDFGKGGAKTITRYGLMGAAFHEGYRAVDWQLQGSNDASAWTDLHAVTGAALVYVMWGGEPFTYYDFDNTVPWQHYRVHVTANAGGQTFANEVGIVEIEMFENAP